MHKLRLSAVWFFAGLLSVLALGCAEPTQPVEQTFPQTKASCQSAIIPNRYIVTWKDGRRTLEVGGNREEFSAAFVRRQLADLALVEPDIKVRVAPMSNLRTLGTIDEISPQTRDWGQLAVGAPSLWSQGFKGNGITVAVIDTGLDITHPQILSRLYANPKEVAGNGIDDDENGLVDDVSGWDFYNDRGRVTDSDGHGTHVSGIISTDHGAGNIKGVAPEAKILPLDFMQGGEGAISDAIDALEYARKQGAKVVNASWGGPGCSTTLTNAIRAAEADGVLFVAAAGNSALDLDSNQFFPAANLLTNQMTVGASTDRNVMAEFSNFSYTFVGLFAPGKYIWSLYPSGLQAAEDGTSMAAPFVSGAAALLWSARPNATPQQIKLALESSVTKGPYRSASQGLLNIPAALTAIKSQLP